MTDRDRNLTANADKRTPDGRFARGNAGKPKGARNRATQAVRDLLDGQVETLTQAAIDKALEGDVAAMRLCLERVHPPIKDTPISFDLPVMASADDAAKAASAILTAVSEGSLSPLEATSVMALVEQFRRALELSDIEQRIAKLEGKT